MVRPAGWSGCGSSPFRLHPHWDAGRVLHFRLEVGQKNESQTSNGDRAGHVSETTRIALAEDMVIVRSALDFAALDATFRAWMPRPVQAFPEVDQTPKQQAVLRNSRTSMVSHFAGSMGRVLEVFDKPVTIQDFATRLNLPPAKLASATTVLCRSRSGAHPARVRHRRHRWSGSEPENWPSVRHAHYI